MKTDTLIILYEPAHVDEAERLRATFAREGKPEPDVLAIDAEVEAMLVERSIVFISGKSLRGPATVARMESAESLVRFFFKSGWDAFVYRDVSLTHIFTFPLQLYLARAFYYVEFFGNLAACHPQYRQWIVCGSVRVTLATSGALAEEEVRVIERAALLIGNEQGKMVTIHQLTSMRARRSRMATIRIHLSRAVFGALIWLYDFLISRAARRGSVRILASDYWRHLAPTFAHLPEAELVSYERSDIVAIPFSALWKHRVRFYHAEQFFSRKARVQVRESVAMYVDAWERKRAQLPPLEFDGHDVQPLVAEALNALMEEMLVRALTTIEGAYAMFEYLRPHALIVRASVSRQLHFAILAIVARACGVPSLELQHGHEYIGSGSFARSRAAEYIAVYGEPSKRDFIAAGYSPEKLLVAGSPRFDAYAAHTRGEVAGKFRILIIVPEFNAGQAPIDSYDFQEYAHTLARACKQIPEATVVLKMRPSSLYEGFCRRALEEAFRNVPHRIAQYEAIATLFPDTDVTISTHSTTVLESLQCAIPVILCGLFPSHATRIRTQYGSGIEEGAFATAFSENELGEALQRLAHDTFARAELVRQGNDYLKRNYVFDGNAGKRVADFLRGLGGRGGTSTLERR